MRNFARKSEKKGSPLWMTTYSDMVTLLLCLFVLLFSFSNLDEDKFVGFIAAFQGALGLLDGGTDIRPIKDAPVADVGSIQVSQAEIEQMRAVYEELAKVIEEGHLAGNVELELESRGVVVRFSDRLFFDLGKAELRKESLVVLADVAKVLRNLPNHIRIEGHTDNLPIHNARYPSNWELSTARATTVIRYLIEELGFAPDRLSAAGYGEYRPVADNSTAEGRARNRRVDIVVLRLGLSAGEPGTQPDEAGSVAEP